MINEFSKTIMTRNGLFCFSTVTCIWEKIQVLFKDTKSNILPRASGRFSQRYCNPHKHRGGSSFFPRGGLTHRPRRADFFCLFLRAAKRRAFFFFWLFYEPRSGEPIFLAILRAAFFLLFDEPRSGEPIFLAI